MFRRRPERRWRGLRRVGRTMLAALVVGTALAVHASASGGSAPGADDAAHPGGRTHASSPSPSASPAPTRWDARTRGRVLDAASRYEGTPYRWGGDGPHAFDCSGFTQEVFSRFGVRLPHNAQAQYARVAHVPRSGLTPGDLVFARHKGGGIYHVGIYAGGHRMWAATKPGDTVRRERMWTDAFVVGRPQLGRSPGDRGQATSS